MRLSLVLQFACACIPFATAQAQRRSAVGGSDRPDTVPSTRVVLIPAVDRYNVSRLEGGIKNLKVLAVYTTDGHTARALAAKVQASVGGPLVTLERAGRSADDFARALVDTIVEKTGRRNMNRAIIVIAEPDLVRPFVYGAVGERGATGFDESGGMATFVIFVRADNGRLLTMRPF
jgi:hypothetical protein